MLVLASLVKTRLCKHLKNPSGFNGICDASAMDALPTELFVLVTRRPLILSRETKELCFTTPSLAVETMGVRLGVVKQSFFGLPGQYGRRVTRANQVAQLGAGTSFSRVPKLYGPFSGVTIPFVSQERRGFRSSNFTVIFLFVTLKTC